MCCCSMDSGLNSKLVTLLEKEYGQLDEDEKSVQFQRSMVENDIKKNECYPVFISLGCSGLLLLVRLLCAQIPTVLLRGGGVSVLYPP
jgi:hypothetical protein